MSLTAHGFTTHPNQTNRLGPSQNRRVVHCQNVPLVDHRYEPPNVPFQSSNAFLPAERPELVHGDQSVARRSRFEVPHRFVVAKSCLDDVVVEVVEGVHA